jgi:hypothetical protein
MAGKSKLSGSQLSLIVGGVLVVIGAGVFAAMWQANSAKHAADDYAKYATAGPPCPTRTAADLETNGPHLRHTFEFGDMSLSYSSGGADCAWIKGQDGKLAVCKFDSPGSLGVSLKGAPQILYAPGIGHSAAILFKGGQVGCVMSPRLTVDAG